MQLKNKKCIICGRDDQPHFSKKRCKSCAQQSYAKIQPKNKTSRTTINRTEQRGCLKEFFERHVEILQQFPRSQNTGEFIPHPSIFNICHLIPKSKAISVACNDYNVIYLTIDEHSLMDDCIFKHDLTKVKEQMPNVYRLMKEKLTEILPLTVERNKMFDYLCEEFKIAC